MREPGRGVSLFSFLTVGVLSGAVAFAFLYGFVRPSLVVTVALSIVAGLVCAYYFDRWTR